ncbi:MAG: protein-L-isoaspartate(D-aspartate) O-methyltransferase [Candidatus Zixiibacteriota bacterium]|nr:MAG: protein-L-isoaspartate(D-aspartate) O-methyltransferase [candidate division Zixibacteria bacterium]
MSRKFGSAVLITVTLCFSFCSRAQERDSSEVEQDYHRQRESMVAQQIEARGVLDVDLLAAMRKVERHRFVPDKMKPHAYRDYPLPIGEDQTISQPYIVALMTELLALQPEDKVLEIGTGSGYQAAVLAELVDSVFTIEIVVPLAERAEALLKELEYDNVFVRCGDGYAGWPEHAPFDGIIVTCAPPRVPEPLKEQLAEGGRMVIPVGTMWQELMLIRKRDGRIVKESVIPVRFVPMTGKALEDR